MPTFQAPVRDGQILLFVTVGNQDEDRGYTALLDTGAQRTMVSPKVVSDGALVSIGSAGIMPASGTPIQTPKYRVSLGIAIARGGQFLVSGTDLEVAELQFQPSNFDVLLGMDFLEDFHLTMYGGSFILSN